jgi:signal transduction histidine kinase
MHHPSAINRVLLSLLAILSLSTLKGESQLMTIAEARAHWARRDHDEKIRVRGIVTFSHQRMGLAYVQDTSGGIGFDPRTRAARLPIPGELIEVEGYLTQYQGMAMILKDPIDFGAPKVTLIEGEELKITPPRFDLDHASQMRIDGMAARVTGVVRNISVPDVESMPMRVEISSPSGYVIAALPWRESKTVLDSWLNAPVTLRAVLICRANPPMLPPDADALLLVPAKANWIIQSEALEEVFRRPPIVSASAIPATPRSTLKQRIHVAGVVTAAKEGSWITLRTEDGSLEVSTRQAGPFTPGQKLSVACWPHNKVGMLTLQDGICRVLGEGPAPQPIHLSQGFFHDGMQRELVEVAGTLHIHSLPGSEPHLTLSLPSGAECLVDWETFLQPEQMQDLQDGSRVRLTGLCHLLPPSKPSEALNLSILPRSLDDIQVLKGPSWWTVDRLMLAVWWLLGITGVALPGALIFRWQLWRQAHRIREIESEAATEEERLRIAREFHDSLQQQLTSAGLHLETLKGALHAAPDMLPRLIDDTTAMIRHCQIEARHCIWDLRSETHLRSNLSDALEDWLKNSVRHDLRSAILFERQGASPKLPENVSFQLMRIAQEAVANALAHANANRILVKLKGSSTHLELLIEDDGHGFEPRLLSQPRPGHFGLSGLKERASKIGASLELATNPGSGTRIRVHLPLLSLKHETCP